MKHALPIIAVLALFIGACSGDGDGTQAVSTLFSIVEAPLAEGTEYIDYVADIDTEGGMGSDFSWRVFGDLPSGLHLTPGTPKARIEGVPLAPGVYQFILEADDHHGNIAHQQFSITIAALTPSQLAIKTLSLPAACQGIAYSAEIIGAGGSGGYQWTIAGPGAPSGLVLSAFSTPNGVYSGTPGVTGDYSFLIRLRDSAGATTFRTLAISVYAPGSIHTYAGGPRIGFAGDNGPAAGCSLFGPRAVAVNSAGDVFIADLNNNRVRKVDAATGIISTVAGNGQAGTGGDGGLATAAALLNPGSLAFDGSDNLYIGGPLGVRRVDAATGVISTVAGGTNVGFSGDGGPATQALFAQATGIALDTAGNLYVCDSFNNRLRRVDAVTGEIDTIAGTGTAGGAGDGGPAISAELDEPRYVAVDSQGNIYVSEGGNSGNIRRIDAVTADIETVAYMTQAEGMAIDASDELYAVDPGDHNVYHINIVTHAAFDIAGNNQSGFSGDGGPAANADLNFPTNLCFDAAGNLYITDTGNHRVRRILQP